MKEVIDLFPTPILIKQLDYPVDEIETLCQQEYSKNSIGITASNIGGWHSDNINYPGSPFSFLFDIEKICQEFARDVLSINRYTSMNMAWININHKGDSNQVHTHPGCVVSGVYYIKTPKECGNIELCHPATDMLERDWNIKFISTFNCYNSQRWRFPPEEGCLYIFPSWLKHMVKSNMSNEDRISISFNVAVM